MGFWLAFLICALGTAGLFYLDRDKSRHRDKALWLPVIWLWITGSRPISSWLGIWFGIGATGSGPGGLDAQLDGSPTDAVFLFLLLVAGVAVLIRRKRASAALLKVNLPILIYFVYGLISCLWSPFPDVAFKRWIKDMAELTMVLVVVTDAEPIAAFRRLFCRVGFILLPASILLIRYSPLGLGFTPEGGMMNTGVTTNKNTLGLTTFGIAIGALWIFINLLRNKRHPYRTRKLIASGILTGFGIAVLYLAHSATSTACFALGTVLILATHTPIIRRRPQRIYALILSILVFGAGAVLLGGEATVLGAMGRDTTLTGRTLVWQAAIPVCPNPLLGAGFESFWNGYGKKVDEGLPNGQKGLNSAHNGYIEVYLNLGLVGLGLIVWLLISGFRSACAAFRRNAEIGSLMLAFVATATIYGISEAGFRIMTATWFSLLLAIVSSRGVVFGLIGGASKPVRKRARAVAEQVENYELASAI